MASGDILPVEKEWQQIQEEITCSICRELFTDPKTISCLHTFCKQCIEKSLESNKKMGSIVCCPLCRTPFPREGVSFVPTNFTINRLVEIFRKRKESCKSLAPKELRCESCETVNLPAVMWCIDCSNSFCVECKDAHNRLKAFKSHATVAVDEFLKNPKLVLSTSEKPEVCRSHVKQALDLYCKTCSSLICRDCTLKDHPRETHDFDFIDNVVDEERDKIKQANASLERLLKQVRNGIKRIEEIDKDIDAKSETNKRKIQGVYSKIYKLLKKQQEQALEKVNTIKTSLKKTLAMQKENVKFMESQLVSCMEFSNDAISTNRTRQLLTYKNSIIDRVKILTKQMEHASIDPECRADDMIVRCAKPAEFINDSLCDVSGIPHLPHCSVRGPLAISDPVKVTVSLKDVCGFPVVQQSKDIEIRCNKEVEFLQNVRIEEKANGQYHIWYKPKRKEDHLLLVYWRGLVVNDKMPVNIRNYDNIKEEVKATSQPGFNFHAAMQNQGGSIFSGTMGSDLTGSSTTSSGLFTNKLGTNQADNASGMEISNPATGEPQHLSNLTGLGGQGLQLPFGNNSNTTQPFISNSQVNTNQPNMFEGNSSNIFGVNNSVLGNELPASKVFSANPSIAAQPKKKTKRRYPK